jgi:DNA-binding CsgD family transcriptional regulator
MTPEGDRQDAGRRRLDGVDVRTLFEGSGLAMVVLDREHRIVDANDAARSLFELKPEQIGETNVDDMAEPDEVVSVADDTQIAVFARRRFVRPDHGTGPAGPLSAREREILARVARGQDGPEIAEDLVVSPATVRTHIGNAIRKLGARSRAHAIAIALQRGLIEDH